MSRTNVNLVEYDLKQLKEAFFKEVEMNKTLHDKINFWKEKYLQERKITEHLIDETVELRKQLGEN